MKSKNFDFFNLFYSLGAAIVLFGALFKVLDNPYGDYIFVTGLIVEIGVFLVSAFAFSQKDQVLSWERIFPELVKEEGAPAASIESGKQSVVSLGTNLENLSQNLGEIANSFKQIQASITHLDKSLSQLEHSSEGYNEEIYTLKKNMADINAYYSDFLGALNSRTKKD